MLEYRYPQIKYRKTTIRCKRWDYSSNGQYYITICTKDRFPYFGRIVNKRMELSDIGKYAKECWIQTPQHFPGTIMDEYIFMPDHMHGIITINHRLNHGRGAACGAPTNEMQTPLFTLGNIINSYKSAVSNVCHKNNKRFEWQRSYYDHIVHDGNELDFIRRYIYMNPVKYDRERR